LRFGKLFVTVAAMLMLSVLVGSSGTQLFSYATPAGLKVKLTVVDWDTGEPVAKVAVSMDGIPKGTTNSKGQLTIKGVTPGRHTFMFSLGTIMGYFTTDVFWDTDIWVRFWTGYVVLIRVRDRGTQVLSGVAVYMDGAKKGKTDRGGILEIRAVSSGLHTFTLSKRGYCSITYMANINANVIIDLYMQRC